MDRDKIAFGLAVDFYSAIIRSDNNCVLDGEQIEETAEGMASDNKHLFLGFADTEIKADTMGAINKAYSGIFNERKFTIAAAAMTGMLQSPKNKMDAGELCRSAWAYAETMMEMNEENG